MRWFNLVFDRYIHQSYHVALVVSAWYLITSLQWGLSIYWGGVVLSYTLTFLAYNGIKLYPFTKSLPPVRWFVFSIHFIVSLIFFLQLSARSKGLLFLAGLLCLFYVLPLPFSQRSGRYHTGLKILFVAVCWGLVTVILPLSQDQWRGVDANYFFYFLNRIIVIFIAMLPFEISDCERDEAKLGTLPQRIGIEQTKWIGYALLVFIFAMNFFIHRFSNPLHAADYTMAVLYAMALLYSKPSRSVYFTLFWIESIPLVGLLILLIFGS